MSCMLNTPKDGKAEIGANYDVNVTTGTSRKKGQGVRIQGVK